MKTKKLVRKMYEACIQRDTAKQRKLWLKMLKKSLKHRHTEIVQ